MLLQLLSMTNKSSDGSNDDIPKDPRNQQAVGILFLATLPLAFSMLDKPDAMNLLTCGALLGLFSGGLYCISMGLKDGERYDSKPVAKAAKFKGRIIGSAILGLATGLTTAMRGGDYGQIAMLGLITTALSLVSFGLDPLKHKGLDTVEKRLDHKASQLRIRAEARVSEIRANVAPLGDAELMPHLKKLQIAVERMLQAVEDDPTRARSLQKHLGVYLDGAAEASGRFLAVYRGTGDPDAHTRFRDLMRDLGHAFDRKATEYAGAGRGKLDVQIDVLSESLRRDTAHA